MVFFESMSLDHVRGLIAAPLVVGLGIGLSQADIGLLITASILVAGLATLLQNAGFQMVRF